jgi:hypothetical protein
MRKQCNKCPWRTDVDPYQIPDGYSRDLHCNLSSTIAKPGEVRLHSLRVMACHESKIDKNIPCVGWLANQLGPGNNIGLRIAAMRGEIDTDFELVGEQHECFEDTIPE